MSLLECVLVLLLIIGNLMTLALTLKTAEDLQERDKEMISMFRYVAEVERKADKLDSIVQRLEK